MEEELSKGERTRASIVGTAYDLFVTSGYHGTSMRLIADRAGLVVGGVYNHFASKEDIFKAVVRTYHPFVTMIPQLNAATGETAEEILRSTADGLLSEIDRQPGLIHLMFIELVEFNGQHIPDLVESLLPSVFGFLERLAAAPGHLRSFSPPAMLRVFLGGIFAHYLTMTILSHTSLNQAAQSTGGLGTLDDVMEMLLHGIMAPMTPDLPAHTLLGDTSGSSSVSPAPSSNIGSAPNTMPAPSPSPAAAVHPLTEPTPPGLTWKGGRRTTPPGRA